MAAIRTLEEAQKVPVGREYKVAKTTPQVVEELRQYYDSLDQAARREFLRGAVTMFANYENKWAGDVDTLNGIWMDAQSSFNDVNFTVPLLTAMVDTGTTFYTKTKPQYIARLRPGFKGNPIYEKLAKMCQDLAQSELDQMLTYQSLQREFQYMALATRSYRQLVPAYAKNSPSVDQEEEVAVPAAKFSCPGCGFTETTQVEEGEGNSLQQETGANCPECLAPMEYQGVEEVKTTTTTRVKLPRLQLKIPNPTSMQGDFNAEVAQESTFWVKRKRIPKHTAEFYYGIHINPGDGLATAPESMISDRKQREPVRTSNAGLPLGAYGDPQATLIEKVDEVEMWMDPCEYGRFLPDGEDWASKYPFGLYLKVCGDVLVVRRPSFKNYEIIPVQQGVRPAANNGLGMTHIASMNELINNEISLEYSILRTYGFPIQLLNGKYIKELPKALQTIIIDKLPAGESLENMIHRESPSNASGLLGVLAQRVEGYMSYISGTMNPTGMPQQLKNIMGTATGASAVQEMMSDRMGLSMQMRVEADIQTIDAILWFFKQDKRNREVFVQKYDETVIDLFFTEELDSVLYFEAAQGSDQPTLESVNAFKIQSFSQLAANMTGLSQVDKSMYLDILAEVGRSLNIPMEIGTGRKERNLGENRIARILQLYREESKSQEAQMLDPVQFGSSLFQAVMAKERLMLDGIVKSKFAEVQPTEIKTPQEAMMLQYEVMMTSAKVEAFLYDYDALRETYSDWLSSDEGQSAAIPVQVAIGMLMAYAMDMKDKRTQIELNEAREQAAAMLGGLPPGADVEHTNNDRSVKAKQGKEDRADNPPGPLKRDGKLGPGRPEEYEPSTPSELGVE